MVSAPTTRADHRSGLPVERRVEVLHLAPTPPRKKGEHVIILSGVAKGGCYSAFHMYAELRFFFEPHSMTKDDCRL